MTDPRVHPLIDQKFEKDLALHDQDFPTITKKLHSHQIHSILIVEANLRTNTVAIPAYQSALANLTIRDTHHHQREDRPITP